MQSLQHKNLGVYLERLQWELERIGSAQLLLGTAEGVREAYENLLGVQRTTALVITEVVRTLENLNNGR